MTENWKLIMKKTDEIVKLLEKDGLRMISGTYHTGWNYKFNIPLAKYKKRKKELEAKK